MTLPAVTILEACRDPALFERWFRRPETWRAWFAFLRALFGLAMDDDDRQLFERCTGRAEPPAGGAQEAWLVCGRRAGKSMILGLVAVFLAAFRDWSPYLSPGERGPVMVIASDRKQARVIFRYIRALLRVPLLASLVEHETAESLDLSNAVTIEIVTGSFRTLRGYTLVAALCDEIAFWRAEDSANPDAEIIAALLPAMATVPGAMLLCASSPYAKRGALHDAVRKFFGKDGAPLVWKADTRTMNPTVPQSVIDDAYERDPASAAAEYGAEFRSDVSGFLDRVTVEAAVKPRPRRAAAGRERVAYVAFVDPSGGSSDSFTLAIAHAEGNVGVIDCLYERRPPFNPSAVVEDSGRAAQVLPDQRGRR